MRALAPVLMLVLAGCTASTPTDGDEPEAPALVAPTALPTFGPSLLLAGAGPGGLGGEPSVWVGPDGTIYVAAPIITSATLATGFVGLGDFGQIRVWKSTDGGASFTLLNDADGRLTPEGRGNGDADIAVGPDGSVYAIDLGGGVPLYVSRDAGETWEHRGELNHEDTGTDRQWIDAEGELLAVTWANQTAESGRGIDITFSRDRGKTWTEPKPITDGMIQFGPVEIAPGGNDIYIPYSTWQGWDLRLLASHDGGTTWTDHDVGYQHPRQSPLGTGLPDLENHWSPTFIFPVAAADRAGHVYLAFSEYVDGGDTTRLLLMRSDDQGATWTDPVAVATSANAIFPWLVAGDRGQIAISYLASDLPLDPNKGPHEWRLEVAVSRDADTNATFTVAHTVERIHVGSVCNKGGGCRGGLVHNVVYEDRALLDFFEMAMAPDGRLVVTWGATEGGTDRGPKVMFAAQDGGDGLLAS